MNYIQVSIKAGEQEQEILISRLMDFNCTGFEQKDNELTAFFKENDFNRTGIENNLEGFSFLIQTVAEQNWNEVWESNFQPVTVDDFCAVRAHFHKPVENVQHEIIITPKMSFGTGHHATTFMMIRQMKRINFLNKSVFDFGTGTGILAILAEKLGAASVVAVDVDDWSINNAKENFERNNCRHIELYQSSKVPEQQFDIILANINKNVLLQYMATLKKALKIHGCLLLSGLLKDDRKDIANACNSLNLTLRVEIERENWVSQLYDN
jgi:ribosomal protein L11 methyltransferase